MFQPSTLFQNCLHKFLLWSAFFLSISDCCIWLIYTYVWLNTCVWLITDKCGKTISGELTLSTLQGAGYNFRMGEVKKVHLFVIINFSFFFSGTGELFNATFYKRAQDHFRATNSGAGLAEWTYYLIFISNKSFGISSSSKLRMILDTKGRLTKLCFQCFLSSATITSGAGKKERW